MGEIEIRITPALFLFLMAEGRCENFTGSATCVQAGRHPLAKYGADRMCVNCMAKLAQASDSPASDSPAPAPPKA